LIGLDAGVHEGADDVHGFVAGGRETEPACVGGDGAEEGFGDFPVDLDAEGDDEVVDESAGGFGGGVLKFAAAHVVGTDVVIDDEFGGFGFAEDAGDFAELRPGAGIDDDVDVGVEGFGVLDPLPQNQNGFFGIEELEASGSW
jgi:hypothetical protein